MKNSDFFAHEGDYADLNAAKAVSDLSRVIQFRTVNHVDTSLTDYREFDALHAYLKAAFPRIAAVSRWEEVGHSLLITLPGTDVALRPALLMAHQDVVPVVPGTEANWRHDPFSGDVADGFIWGRGAMDIKQMLVGILTAAEYWLGQGRPFRRTLILAFGEDEETCSQGAMAIAALLRERGIELEYVLDEGAGNVTDAADYGAPGTTICSIGVYEKGYCDLRLTAKSKGGHSSNPFRGTSLGALADAIHGITHHMPPARLSEALIRSFQILGERITEEPLATWAKDPQAYEKELLNWCLGRESLYHLVRTTAAPTMISGGSPAGNVMPQDMEAMINFRLIPEDTPESLLARCREAVPEGVTLKYAQQIAASRPSDLDAMGYPALVSVLERYFSGLVFLPQQNRGATDARQYECVCRCVLRFGPFLEEKAIAQEGVHGTNERISIRAYLQGIRVLTRLIGETAL